MYSDEPFVGAWVRFGSTRSLHTPRSTLSIRTAESLRLDLSLLQAHLTRNMDTALSLRVHFVVTDEMRDYGSTLGRPLEPC